MTNGEAPEGAERLDLDAIEARREAAHEMINDLCQRRRDWVMSIPARPNHDPDLVIGASLRDGIRLVAEVRRLTEQRDNARQQVIALYDWRLRGEKLLTLLNVAEASPCRHSADLHGYDCGTCKAIAEARRAFPKEDA